jgi:hypothetical protein
MTETNDTHGVGDTSQESVADSTSQPADAPKMPNAAQQGSSLGDAPTATPNAQSSINQSSWIDSFLGTVVAPVCTFRRIRSQNEAGTFAIAEPLLAVLLVFTVDAFRSTSVKDVADVLWWVPVSLIGGLSLWFSTAAVVALVAMFFKVSTAKIRTASITLGWALLPWLFMTPLSLLAHNLGAFSHVLYVLPGLWVLALQIIALNESFSLCSWQAAVLIFVVPFLLAIAQFLQFTMNLSAVIG